MKNLWVTDYPQEVYTWCYQFHESWSAVQCQEFYWWALPWWTLWSILALWEKDLCTITRILLMLTLLMMNPATYQNMVILFGQLILTINHHFIIWFERIHEKVTYTSLYARPNWSKLLIKYVLFEKVWSTLRNRVKMKTAHAVMKKKMLKSLVIPAGLI